MSTENSEQIIALTIVTLAYMSISFFLFIIIILIFLDMRHILRYLQGSNVLDFNQIVIITFLILIITYVLRILIRWIKTD